MLAALLISIWKNGRLVRTYGVKRENHNMKFTFICIVIVISCGVCASGDLEIYPRLKFNFNQENRRYRVKKYDHPNYYPKFGYPWQISPLEEYREIERSVVPEEETLADKVRQFKEVIDFERAQMKRQGNHYPDHARPRHRLNLEDLNIPKDFMPNFLDEVRMYPQEDDFGFGNDDNEEIEMSDALDRPKFEEVIEGNEKVALKKLRESNEENSHHMHHMEEADTAVDDSGKELSLGRFKDLKVMEDSTDFAYAPPDDRFYRKADTVPEVTYLPDLPNDLLKIWERNKHTQNQEEVTVNEANDEMKTENALKVGNSEVVAVKPNVAEIDSAGVYIIAIVAGISAAATVGLIAVGIGWYNLQKHVKNASDVEYPAYGITGPNKDVSPSGDRRLAQSAQMYHYQHQKQQIIAMERAQPGERHGSVSDAESDEENEEGDYTVYECPGLAPTGEMEVKNPLFQDDPTPAQTPALKPNTEEKK